MKDIKLIKKEVDLAAGQEVNLTANRELPGILIEDILQSHVREGNIKYNHEESTQVTKKPLLQEKAML